MNREEAIKVLNTYDVNFDEYTAEEIAGALDMAIEALSADTSSDLISRADAILWVKTECNPYGKPTLEFESGKRVIEHLKQMPSADPKTNWIPCSERLPEVGEICLLTVHEYGWNCKEYTRVIIGEYSDNYADHILAWMPLPKPYKGGDTK